MTDHAVIDGCFAEAKAVKTRSTFQIVVEVPIERADEALKALGGWPQPGQEKPVAVALLRSGGDAQPEPKEDKPKAPMKLSQQAGMLCNDPVFQRFVSEQYFAGAPINTDEVVEVVRHRCEVQSRSEFDTDEAAARRWRKLHADFEAWKQL